MSPHHIPFPRAFLSLNTPSKKAPESAISTSPITETAPHGFLSNRPVARHPRQESVSSVTSEDSVASSASSAPAATPSASPVLERAMPAFLALNTKHVAPTPAAAPVKDSSPTSAGFLSNRH